MGLGYGLVRGLESLVGGAQAGEAERRELERRARMDALQQRLMEAQTEDISAQARSRLLPAKGEYTLHSDASGTYKVNSATRETERIGGGTPRPGQLGRYKEHVNDDGTVDYIWEPAPGESPPGADAEHPAVVQSSGRVAAKPNRPIVAYDKDGNEVLVYPERPTRPGQSGKVQVPTGAPKTPLQPPAASRTPLVPTGAPKTPTTSTPLRPPPVPGARVVPLAGLGKQSTPQQRDKANFGVAALAAWQPLDRLRQKNPQVQQEVGAIVASPNFVRAIPGFRSADQMVETLKLAGASPAAQAYFRAEWSFMDNIARTRNPTSRMSGQVFMAMMSEFMPGLTPGGNAQIRKNEINAILTAQGGSGYDQNPNPWDQQAKRLGVDSIDLQDVRQGGSGYKKKYPENPY